MNKKSSKKDWDGKIRISDILGILYLTTLILPLLIIWLSNKIKNIVIFDTMKKTIKKKKNTSVSITKIPNILIKIYNELMDNKK